MDFLDSIFFIYLFHPYFYNFIFMNKNLSTGKSPDIIEKSKMADYQTYHTKSILNINKHSGDGWFWVKYSAYPYIGCEWDCQYCYCRDNKYNPHKPERDQSVLSYSDPFSQYIKIKEDAPEMLLKALRNRERDLIYIFAYQPVESQYHYGRKMLEQCLLLMYPVFLNEKSPLILKDLDLLKKISQKSFLNVGWSIITTRDDETRKIFEPGAPDTTSRFSAMKKLAENGIYTGTVFMPILPFIYDDEENIEGVIRKTKESGGKYILDAGLTLWGECGTHFYKILEKYDKNLIPKYHKLYNQTGNFDKYYIDIHKTIVKYCRKYNIPYYIPRPVKHFQKEVQLNKKIAGKLYVRVKEMQLSGESGYKEKALKKSARKLDYLEKGIEEIYHVEGINGIIKAIGCGNNLARWIEEQVNKAKQA